MKGNAQLSNSTAIQHGTLKAYLFGFFYCILLTLAAYFLVKEHLIPNKFFMITVAGLALVQAFVQLIFFLHLGKESKPKWNLLLFFFMGLVVVILVFGTLWIMSNLNYNMMPKMDMQTYMHREQGI